MAAAEEDVRENKVVRVWLELDPHADPIAGTLRLEGEAPAAFVGWLGLTAELERLRARPQGVHGRRAIARGIRALTATERNVAALVCEGLTNPQIAERLGVSRRTVQGHLANVFKKLRVSSRTQLATHLIRAELHASPIRDEKGEKR